jgi:predicted glycogen debranching enzyme
MKGIAFGPQVCGQLAESAAREWLVTDGLGGYAMGTVAGLRTRRYHGLLVVASANGASRHIGLAALDLVLVSGDRRFELATHEWADGTISPGGHELLSRFDLIDGIPRWTWTVGGTVVQREIAMCHRSATVAVTHRVVAAPSPVRIELTPLCTWRNAHGERHAGEDPTVEVAADGFVFEHSYAVTGAGWQAGGEWYRGARLREEAVRGLPDQEDLWAAGVFAGSVAAGESFDVVATADLDGSSPQASDIVDDSRRRAARLVATARATSEVDAQLVLAAEQFIVHGGTAPAVVAGYPWFGAWSRDTMTSYEGLFLSTGRTDEGRALLVGAATTISEGMLANTADTGTLEYNTADGTLWFVHAIGRHVAATGDVSLIVELGSVLDDIIDHHVRGTRYGIRVDLNDGLLVQGEVGQALTWMDARVDGVPVTQRGGKAVDINALWINCLRTVAELKRVAGSDVERVAAERLDAMATRAAESFARRFVRPDGLGLFDVVDGAQGDDATIRPNQLLALSLPHGPGGPESIVEVCRDQLLTPLGLRSLSPADGTYIGQHRGDSRARDLAYHHGTVWPWLLGPFADAARAVGASAQPFASIDVHLAEWGLGSVSETADGNAPHAGTGCPFQAWSVAEVLRTRLRT